VPATSSLPSGGGGGSVSKVGLFLLLIFLLQFSGSEFLLDTMVVVAMDLASYPPLLPKSGEYRGGQPENLASLAVGKEAR
jgi:hypothetical protein